jgi:hypothetical protein
LRRLLKPETGERAMDSDDQSVELIWSELMMPHIAARDARDLIEIDPERRGLGHCVLPLLSLTFWHNRPLT